MDIPNMIFFPIISDISYYDYVFPLLHFLTTYHKIFLIKTSHDHQDPQKKTWYFVSWACIKHEMAMREGKKMELGRQAFIA